ncbi:MAG: helix-turn-helix domain-containing protein [Zavarzinia sp.]|nr:helix-turn-helix domain-containing protein [Zavarzinia sp.]
MKRTRFAQMNCSLARGLDVIGDWWTPLIVRDLFLGIERFDDLAEDLGISRNLLTRRLRALLDNGIVERRIYQRKPTRYAYALSEAGRDLVPAILALTAWGERWAGPAEGSPFVFRHGACGHIFEAEVCCDACRAVLKAEAVDVLPGPGLAAKPGTMVIARRLAAADAAPNDQEHAGQDPGTRGEPSS